MADFEKKLDYTASGADPGDIKTKGFQAGYKPPASFFNWLFTRISDCIDDLQTYCLKRKIEGYTAFDQIGITLGNETIEEIATKLPNNTKFISTISDSNAKIYPKDYGVLIVTKKDPTRTIFEFYEKGYARKWYGMYDSSKSSSKWTGWDKNVTDVDLTDFTSHIQNKSNPHNVTKEQLGIDLTDFEEHLQNKGNPHKVTAAQVNAVSKNGDTMTGNLAIDTLSYPNVVMKNQSAKREGYIEVGSTGAISIGTRTDDTFDNAAVLAVNPETNDSKELLHISKTEKGAKTTFNVYHTGNKPTANEVGALPITGGKLIGNTVNFNDNGKLAIDGNGALLETYADSGDVDNRRGFAVYDKSYKADTKNAFLFYDEVEGAYTQYLVYGEHNKPSGTYTGNGSATKRTINTGGVGNVLFIWAKSKGDASAEQETKIYVLPTGAVAFGNDNASDRGVTSAEMKYENGVLTINTAHNWFNQSGITYNYQCL